MSGFLSSPRDTAVTALPSCRAQSHVDAHTVTSSLGVGRRTPHDNVWEPIRGAAPSLSRLPHRRNSHEQAASEAERSRHAGLVPLDVGSETQTQSRWSVRVASTGRSHKASTFMCVQPLGLPGCAAGIFEGGFFSIFFFNFYYFLL